MYKKLIAGLLVLMMPLQAYAAPDEKKEDLLKYSASGFTQPEKQVKEQAQAGTVEGFEKAAENEYLILYVNEDSLALKILDKKTNYIWNSGIDQVEGVRLNKTWEQMAQSAVTIEYSDRRGKIKSESIQTNDSRPNVKITDNGFSAKVYMNGSKISLELSVTLEKDNIAVSIPDKELKEGKRNKLISMKVYPFLGAVNGDERNGYMFIPDGSGALIRYEKGSKADAPFKGAIYGADAGFQKSSDKTEEKTVPAKQISMPVFGAVHGIKKNGFAAIVEKGAEYGDILAYPSGVSTDFNWTTAQFNYRYEYYQPTSKSMSGTNVYQKKKNAFDISLRYYFLSNEQADYVGMAKRYQEYLIETKQLAKKEDRAEVRLEFLGSETKKGLFWDSVIPMTPVEKLPDFAKELKKEKVEDMFMIYKGWSKGGLTGTLPSKFPVEKKLGSKGDVKDATEALENENVPLFFQTDYTKAYENAGGFSGSKDVSKKVSSETISYKKDDKTYYYLSPDKSLKIAKEDLKQYSEYGMKNAAVDGSSTILFSDYTKGNRSSRIQTAETYNKLFSQLHKAGEVALYNPNAYAWGQTDRFLDAPMTSSNYIFESDTVPFLQIVLKGYIPYYAEFSNFHSDSKDDVLRMIEYGAYPSFYLTDEPSHLLMKTPSKDLYTSEFDSWKDEIVNQYKMMQESLGAVEGETIESRTVPAVGIVEVSYSNGKTIIVNYTNTSYRAGVHEIPAKGFIVTDGGDKQ
ncbi:DUF5696 domain-containing protein [Peribacillus frigoritolerans]|uniref:DUF5696 domain-containing protein n=1 Tax=Peribacillus frigoritolerans TaxID=450367 RepID=UPI00105A08BA|nr:DUF5696 domain-containing protein [Peribacillus frigoritolerans]TDL79111.1 hypothetical protein E2R53_16905 [Peribacillus frigoritolerans]